MSEGLQIDDVYILLGYKMDKKSKEVLDDEKKKTEDELEKWADNTSSMLGDVFKINFFSDLYEGIRDLAVGLVSELSPSAMLARADEWSQVADEINKTSRDIGLNGEAWQTWQFIARRTGTDVDELRNSFNKIGIELGNAAAGSKEKKKLFDDLGLSVEQLLAMDPAARLEAVTAALRAIPDDTKRLQLGAKLFGEDALRKMTRLLNASASEIEALKKEAADLGIIPNAALEQASKFQDTLANLQQITDASASTFVLRYLPALDEMLVEFTELYKVARPFVDEVLGAPADLFATGVEYATEMIRWLRETIDGMPEEMGEILDQFGGWTNAGRLLLGVVLSLGGAFAVLKAPAAAAAIGKFLAFMAPLLAVGLGPLLAIAAALGLFLGAVQDVYTFFNSQDASQSLFARLFGLDPKVAADIEKGKKIALTLLRIFNPLLMMPIAIANNWEEIKTFVLDLIAFFVDSVNGLLEWLGKEFGFGVVDVMDLIAGAQDAAGKAFRALFDWIMFVYDLFDGALLIAIKIVLGVLVVGILAIIGLVSAFAVGLSYIPDILTGIWGALVRMKDGAIELFQFYVNAIVRMFELGAEKIGALMDRVTGFFRELPGGFDFGGDLSASLLGSIAPGAATAGLLPGTSSKTVVAGNGDKYITIDARGRDPEEVKEEYNEGFFDIDKDFLDNFFDDEQGL